MIEHPKQHYPHNKPYVQESQSQGSSSPKLSRQPLPEDPSNLSPSAMTASALADRVQDLEEQLILLANTLNEEGKQNQGWQQQLSNQNMQLRAELNDREQQISVLSEKLKYSEEQVKLLKDNLFKQNEQMEVLHRELQQSRLHVSKIQRTNGSQLEEKVLELNDEISTLLVKIQQLIEENNQQTSYIEDLERAIRQFKTAHESLHAQIQKLTDENHYLKEEIKEVENLSMSQQKDVQDKLLHELESAKEQLQQLRKALKEREINDGPTEMDKKQNKGSLNIQNEKELNSLRSEVHSLEEEIIQQREIERSLRKKYEERLRNAEDQVSSLSEELLKLKHKNRQLQNQRADHTFALEQLRKQKSRGQSRGIKATDVQHYQGMIARIEEEKERMKTRIHKLQAFQHKEHSSDYYIAALNESEAKISILRQQLAFAEEELTKSKRSSREAAELAKHWQEDYRRLSQEYQEALRSRSNFEDKMRRDQAELARHKEIYQQLVRKYDDFEGMYRQLQAQVRLLEEQKGKLKMYDKQATELVKIQNSALKQEISQLKRRVQELSYQILEKQERPDRFLLNEIQRYKTREKELERLLEDMRVRLSHSQTTVDPRKLREMSDQLQRVNRMLNQKQMELDSMKEKYEDLHAQLNKKDIINVLPKHYPQLSRLKAQYVAVQRKLMENELAAKNALQNAQYEMQALRIQNAHHRKKIDELLRELTSQRTTTDYRNLLHSLELAESRNRELERQIQHCQSKIKDLHDQLRRPRSRSRRGSDLKPSRSQSSLIINQVTPRQQTKPEERQRSSQINKLKQEKGVGSASFSEKENGYSSVYEQLMKQRQQLRVARSQFENKWGNLSIGSNILQNQSSAIRIQERVST